MPKSPLFPTEHYRNPPSNGGPQTVLPDGTPKPLSRPTQGGRPRVVEQPAQGESRLKKKAKKKAIGWTLAAMGLSSASVGLTSLIF